MKKFRTIIIVDDDATTVMLNRRLLNKMDITQEILTFTDPYLAQKYLHEEYSITATAATPDLILLDLEMPGMNGFDFLDDIETLALDRCKLFIMMLTSSISPKHREQATLLGNRLDRFTNKPLREELLIDLLSIVQ